jgi:hypothetical protein
MEQIPVAASPAKPRCLVSPVEVGDVGESAMEVLDGNFVVGVEGR